MIDKTNIIDTVCEKLTKMHAGECLDLRTYKRNRSVLVVKENEEAVTIVEDGFYKERFKVSKEKIRKTLKSILRKEFPRSRKIRIYSLGSCREYEQGAERKKL